MTEQQIPTEKSSNIPAAVAQQNRQEEILNKFKGESQKPDNANQLSGNEEKKVDPPATDFSKGFAALARKEKMLRDKEESWKKERDTFKPKVDEYDKISDIIGKAKSKDPASIKAALEILGLSAGEISQMALMDPSMNEDPQLLEIKRGNEQIRKELEELKAYRAEKLKEEEDQKMSRETETNLNAMKAQVDGIIKANLDKFDLCSCLGDDLVDNILEIGDAHYTKTEEILPLEKILEMIEDREEKRYSKFAASKKFGKPSLQDASKTGTTSPTLTNKIEQGSPVNIQGLTGDARMNALIKKYQ
jgi:hypothetical protein